MNTQQQAKIDDRAILFRIPRTFTYSMSNEEVYEITRKAWVVGERREKANYALAVVKGRVVAVFTINHWYPSKAPERWEFEGESAPNSISKKYVGADVSGYFMRGNSNPVLYVNC